MPAVKKGFTLALSFKARICINASNCVQNFACPMVSAFAKLAGKLEIVPVRVPEKSIFEVNPFQ